MSEIRAQDTRGARYVLRCTMPGPDSSYSCFEHQRFWNVLRDARIEPPIQTEYLRSGGATILTFMLAGERLVSSFCMRSAMPGNIVVPPERTTLLSKLRRTLTSHLKIELYLRKMCQYRAKSRKKSTRTSFRECRQPRGRGKRAEREPRARGTCLVFS